MRPRFVRLRKGLDIVSGLGVSCPSIHLPCCASVPRLSGLPSRTLAEQSLQHILILSIASIIQFLLSISCFLLHSPTERRDKGRRPRLHTPQTVQGGGTIWPTRWCE